MAQTKTQLLISGLIFLVIFLGAFSAYMFAQNQTLASNVSALSGKVDQLSTGGSGESEPATRTFSIILVMFGMEEEEARHRWISSSIMVKRGDTVVLEITNTDDDSVHGFGIAEYGINETIQPGETVTVEFVADKAGFFIFYCTRVGCAPDHAQQVGQLVVL